MSILFHAGWRRASIAAMVFAFSMAIPGTRAAAQEGGKKRVELKTQVVEFSQEQYEKLPSDGENAKKLWGIFTGQERIEYAGNISPTTTFPFSNIFDPPKEKPKEEVKKPIVAPKTVDEIIARLEKKPDGTMVFHTPMNFTGVFTSRQIQVTVGALKQVGCKPVTAPTIVLDSGGSATIRVMQKFVYSSKLSKEVGEMTPVKADVGPDGETIDLEIAPEVTSVAGLLVKGEKGSALIPIQESATGQKGAEPVFSKAGDGATKTIITVWHGQTALFVMTKLEMQPGANGKKPRLVSKTVAIMITAQIVGMKDD